MKSILRAIGIVFLKWVALFLGIGYVYRFFPSNLGDVLPILFVWVVVFIVSFLFSLWLMSEKAPTKKQLGTLLAIWLAVTLTCFLAYGLRISFLGIRSILSIQIIGQIIVELVAVLVTASRLRRRSLKNELGEGAM